jgi:hypothetical protein
MIAIFRSCNSLALALAVIHRQFQLPEPRWKLMAELAGRQQAGDQLRCHHLSGAGEEGLGEGWVTLGRRGGVSA